jgi:hypothetical protein
MSLKVIKFRVHILYVFNITIKINIDYFPEADESVLCTGGELCSL